MKIVAASVRGPLIADESRETARFIGFFRRLDRFAPGAAIGRRPRRREALRHLPLAEAGDDIDGGLRALAGIDLVVPLPALRRRQQAGIAADQLREKAHAVRMVRYDQEIQRSRKFGALSAGSDDFLALGKTIGVLRAEPSAERARVHRERSVQVRVAEVRPRRKIAPRIWRVRRLGGKRLLGRLLVERADVSGCIFRSDGRCQTSMRHKRRPARLRRSRTSGSSSAPLRCVTWTSTPSQDVSDNFDQCNGLAETSLATIARKLLKRQARIGRL